MMGSQHVSAVGTTIDHPPSTIDSADHSIRGPGCEYNVLHSRHGVDDGHQALQ
jgi:hypothetical protein